MMSDATKTERTRRKGLLQLLGLLRVVDREGVEVARAPKLELGAELATGGLCGNLLDTRSYRFVLNIAAIQQDIYTRTASVLALSVLDELLDVGELLRLDIDRQHFGHILSSISTACVPWRATGWMGLTMRRESGTARRRGLELQTPRQAPISRPSAFAACAPKTTNENQSNTTTPIIAKFWIYMYAEQIHGL